MPDNITPPPGYALDAPQAATPTPPPGYNLDPNSALSQTTGIEATKPNLLTRMSDDAQARQGGPGLLNNALGTAEGVAAGGMKDIREAENGAANLGVKGLNVAKAALGIPDSVAGHSTQIPPIPTDPHLERQGIAEHAGAAVSELAQWAGMDEGLKSITKAAATPQAILDFLDKHETAAKIILDTLKGGTVGAAKGSVDAAAKNEPVGPATVKGAEGGAAGGAVAAGTEEALGAAGKATGISGLEPEEKIRKAGAGSASLKEQNLEENTKRALPRIAKQTGGKPIESPKDYAEAAHAAKQDLWSGPDGYKAMIARHPADTISGDDIAKDVKNSISPTTRKLYPKQAANIEEWADQFNGKMPLDEAAGHLVELNQRMRDFYSLSKADQFKMATANPELGMLQDATDSLRNSIDAKLSSLGEKGSADLRKDYGALSQQQRIFERRHIVYGRQSPVDLKTSMGAVASIASGHPLAAAVPFVSKYLNDPTRLINSALADTIPTGGTKPIPTLARTAGKAGKRAFETASALGGQKIANSLGDQNKE